jgi:hypothetical protein
MANAYLEIEEYLWFTEYQQGNVNVAGLIFDDLIEESVDLCHEAYTVWNDQIEETLGIAEAFTPYHQAYVADTFSFIDLIGGSQTRVKQSVLNIVYTKPVAPISVAHMHLDIVMSGSDSFQEEVFSELQIHSTYANAVPYYWEQLFESFNIEMAEPQPYLPIYLRLYLSVSDLVNMRHDVAQEYLFTSTCREEIFLWDGIIRGWDHLVSDSLANTDIIEEIIGKIADDYLFLEDTPAPRVLVVHIVKDQVFAFDAGVDEKFYLLTAADIIDVSDIVSEFMGYLINEYLILQEVQASGVLRYCSAEDAFRTEDDSVSERFYLCLADDTVELVDSAVTFLSLDETALERFNASATAVPVGTFVGLACESLTFRDIDTYIQGIIIQEDIAMGDVELTRWVFNVMVESGCDTTDIIG